MAIEITQWAACITSVAAWKEELAQKGAQSSALFHMFVAQEEAEAWIARQVQPQRWIVLPTISLRAAAYNGTRYTGPRLGQWAQLRQREDLGMPDTIELESDSEIRLPRYFIDDADYQALKKIVKTDTAGPINYPENEILRWLIVLDEVIYATFPSASVELLVVLYTSYQVHMEIESHADSLLGRWWSSGWSKLTKRKCHQAASRVRQRLYDYIEQVSLVLPPGPLVAEQQKETLRTSHEAPVFDKDQSATETRKMPSVMPQEIPTPSASAVELIAPSVVPEAAHHEKKKRGRKPRFTSPQLVAARDAKIKNAGKRANREAAKILYSTSTPTAVQCRNVPKILKYHGYEARTNAALEKIPPE